jgi:hypothetical protein
MFLYTPPYSEFGIGTVYRAQMPDEPVSPASYRFMLEKRIAKLLAEADRDEIEPILHELELQENLNLLGERNIAELLVEFSQTLRELAAYPVEPIPTSDWEEDPETEDALRHETAEEFLQMLVR